MRDYRVILVLVAALTVFTVVSYYFGYRPNAFDPFEDHSSLRTNPRGTKALRELLAENGLTTKTLRRPLTHLPPDRGVLFLIGPHENLSAREIEGLLAWVAAGRHAVIAVEGKPGFPFIAASPLYPSDRLLAHLGLGLVTTKVADVDVKVPRSDEPALQDVTMLHVPGPHRLVRLPTKGAVRDFLSKLVKRRRGKPGERETVLPDIVPLPPDEFEPLVGSAKRGIVVMLRYGRGRVYVVCEADMLSNGWIRRADNVVLAANIAFAEGGRGPVYFDEYHHPRAYKYGEREGIERLKGTSVLAALSCTLGGRCGASAALTGCRKRLVAVSSNTCMHLPAFTGGRMPAVPPSPPRLRACVESWLQSAGCP